MANEHQPFDANVTESGLVHSDFKVGDKVQVITNRPYYSWGDQVKRGDVGILVEVSHDAGRYGNFIIDFDNHKRWRGLPGECLNLTAMGSDQLSSVDCEQQLALSPEELIKETKELAEQLSAMQAKVAYNKRILRDTYQLEII